MLMDTAWSNKTEIRQKVVSEPASSPSPTSVSRHPALALPCTPPPTRPQALIKDTIGTRKLIVQSGILPPFAAYPTC